MFSRLMAKARLRHLQLLVAVADQGNLKHAAEEVGLSQPAATQAIAELEQLLELRLFERHSKGMRLAAGGSIADPGHSQRAGGAAGRDRRRWPRCRKARAASSGSA